MDWIIVTEVGPDRDGKPAVFQRLLAGVPKTRGPAPVHLWNPDYCGEIDMRIAADGSWHYNGSPINRIAMVKLFSTILRKDSERYVLVTPVERIGITVDDAPFLAVELDKESGIRASCLFVRTSLDDVAEIGHEHAIIFATAADGGLKPYIHIRGDLWALASRALTHELIGLATTEMVEKLSDSARTPMVFGQKNATFEPNPPLPAMYFGIRSGDAFFPICPADAAGAEA